MEDIDYNTSDNERGDVEYIFHGVITNAKYNAMGNAMRVATTAALIRSLMNDNIFNSFFSTYAASITQKNTLCNCRVINLLCIYHSLLDYTDDAKEI